MISFNNFETYHNILGNSEIQCILIILLAFYIFRKKLYWMVKKKNYRNRLTLLLICFCMIVSGLFFNEFKYHEFSGFLICGSFLLLLYGYIFYILKFCGILQIFKCFTNRQKYFMIFSIIISNLFVFAEINRDRFVYFWDYGGYWGVTIEQSKMYFINSSGALGSLIKSINNNEYNNIIPSLLALPIKIMGEDFLSYVLVVFNMFIIPTCFILLFIIIKIINKTKWLNEIPVCMLIFGIIITPSLYMPVFWGYLDSFSLLCVALSILLITDGFFSTFSIEKCIYTSSSLLMAMLGRRYFAFYVIGFVCALCIAFLYEIYI